MPQPNGPRVGKGTGRFRNTLANNASKTVPVVSAGSAVGYGAQMGQLQQNLYDTLAGLQAQKGLIYGQMKTDRAAAKSNRIAGASAAEADALGRGIVGSSADLSGRAAVVAQQKTELAAAVQQRTAGMLGLHQARIQAQNQYQTGVFDVLAQKQAEKAQMANEAFMQDLVMRQGDEQSAAMDAFLAALKAAQTSRTDTKNNLFVTPPAYGTDPRTGEHYDIATKGRA